VGVGVRGVLWGSKIAVLIFILLLVNKAVHKICYNTICDRMTFKGAGMSACLCMFVCV
jgi:hypothetical protein